MIEEINTALDIYQARWQKLVGNRKNKTFFKSLKPTALGWKTEDFPDFQRIAHELRDECDHLHMGWVNERWIGTMHLRSQKLGMDIELFKLMQRRPGSNDMTGLDHVDFLLPQGTDAKTVLATEPDIKWTEEKNGEHCSWISIWFGSTEAKLRSNTTLGVVVAELQDINMQVAGR